MPAHWKPVISLSMNTDGGEALAMERLGVGPAVAVWLAREGVFAGAGFWRADISSPPPTRPTTSAADTANANLARRTAGAGETSPRKPLVAPRSQASGMGWRDDLSGSSCRKLRSDGGTEG